MGKQWNEIIQEYQTRNYLVYTRESITSVLIENLIAETSASLSTQTFLRQLADSRVDLWDALLRSIQSLPHNVKEEDLFIPLKLLIEHVTKLAVLSGEEDFWKSPNKWSYLIEVTHLGKRRSPCYFLLHPPAEPKHIQQAEVVLGRPLPPTFVRFLLCTNGFGLGAQEFWYIRGVGEDRAFWPDLASWLRPSCHEIASDWWQWQDQYAYERQMDRERGITLDRSDEQICIPFAQTGDDWCFDSAHQDETGEYPVLSWDHEIRRATWEYPSFEAWFLESVLRANLFEEEPEED